jgi:MFS family permease
VLLSAIFAIGLAHAEFRATFGKLMLDKFGLVEQQAGWLFAFMGFVAIVVQGGLVRRIAPLLGDKRAILVGLPIGIIGYACIPLAPAIWAVYAAIALCGLGMGLAGPPTTGILSRTAPLGMEGAAMGASQSAASLGLVIGPLIAGALYDYVGGGWPFWTAATFIGVGLVIIIMGVKSRPSTQQVDVPPVATEL